MKVLRSVFSRINLFFLFFILSIQNVFAAGEFQKGLELISNLFSGINIVRIYEIAPEFWDFIAFFSFFYHFVFDMPKVKEWLEDKKKVKVIGSSLLSISLVFSNAQNYLAESYIALFIFGVAIGVGFFKLFQTLFNSGEQKSTVRTLLALTLAILAASFLIGWMSGHGSIQGMADNATGAWSSVWGFFSALLAILTPVGLILLIIVIIGLFSPLGRYAAGRVASGAGIPRDLGWRNGRRDQEPWWRRGRGGGRGDNPVHDASGELGQLNTQMNELQMLVAGIRDHYRHILVEKQAHGLADITALGRLNTATAPLNAQLRALNTAVTNTVFQLEQNTISEPQQAELLNIVNTYQLYITQLQADATTFEGHLAGGTTW